jgi:CRP/FNR family transcriptional regulator
MAYFDKSSLFRNGSDLSRPNRRSRKREAAPGASPTPPEKEPAEAHVDSRPALAGDSSRDPVFDWPHRAKIGLLSGLDADTAKRLPDLVTKRIRLHKGQALYSLDKPFTALYAVLAGSFKTVVIGDDGEDQVTGHHMVGDVIGLDGIGADVHHCTAIALEDSEVCMMPFDRVEQAARDWPKFQHNFHRYLAREIARQRSLIQLLSTTSGEKRLVTFLLELSERYHARGYSASEFILRMKREDIGSYLGLQLETVSRLLSRLHSIGLIHVRTRTVKLVDRAALKHLAHTGWRWGSSD